MNSEQFSTALSRLHGMIEALERAWLETAAHWDDGTQRHFEEFRLRPIFSELQGVIEATVPARDCFAQARRECTPQDSIFGRDAGRCV